MKGFPRCRCEQHSAAALLAIMLMITPAFARAQSVPDQTTEGLVKFYRDGRAAIEELRGKAESGDRRAQFLLGAAYYDRGLPGIDRDDEAAMKWLSAAAAKGEPEAMTALGIVYARGRAVPIDLTLSKSWLLKALNADDWRGTFLYNYVRLGGSLSDELVGKMAALQLEQDDKTAFGWYMRTAGGNSGAQNQIALAFQMGRGVKRDESMAVFFEAMALRDGFKQAANNLKRMLSDKEVFVVQAHDVVLHNSPDTSGKAIATLKRGSKVYLLDRNGAPDAWRVYDPTSRDVGSVLPSALAPVATAPKRASNAKKAGASSVHAAKQAGVTRCTTRCINGDCNRVYEDGRKVHFQAKRVWNAMKNEFEWDSSGC